VRFAFVIGGARALDAGVTWAIRTTSAPWAGRSGHTSVIDAAGAIYVIGGSSGTYQNLTYYHDVWASTDGGARPYSRRGWSAGGTRWVLTRVLQGYYRGTIGGNFGALWGTTGELGVPTGYLGGTGVL
jgi:hypothetical protein